MKNAKKNTIDYVHSFKSSVSFSAVTARRHRWPNPHPVEYTPPRGHGGCPSGGLGSFRCPPPPAACTWTWRTREHHTHLPVGGGVTSPAVVPCLPHQVGQVGHRVAPTAGRPQVSRLATRPPARCTVPWRRQRAEWLARTLPRAVGPETTRVESSSKHMKERSQKYPYLI